MSDQQIWRVAKRAMRTASDLRVFLAVSFLLSGLGLKAGQTASGGKPASQAAKSSAPPTQDYRVGAGDVLEINVWKEPDVSSPSVIVRPDGKISLPLAGDVLVSGKTPLEIQAMLEQVFSPSIKSPTVTVIVKEIRSKRVYILGEVAHPGSYDITQPLTILQLLTAAGGLQPFAKQKSIYVLRNEGGRQQKLSFNYKEVIQGKKIEQNVQLQPGDTVVVP
jgi:polysaccharide biosynthesis/export protein